MRKCLTVILLSMMILPNLKGQDDLLLYNFREVPQTLYSNPSMIPRSSFAFGLPVISSFQNNIFNSAYSFNDLFHSRKEDDSLVFDPGGIIPMLDVDNHWSVHSAIDLIFLGIKVNRGYLSFAVRSKAYARMKYPKTLMEFAWYGNSRYIEEELDFSETAVDFQHYLSYRMGYAVNVGGGLELGLAIKVLKGLSVVETETMDVRLRTDFDEDELFSFSGRNDILINTAGLDQFDAFSPGDYLTAEGNSGFAFDVGLNWEMSPDFLFSLSFTDVGYIHWSSGLKTYESANKNIDFSGVEVDLTADENALDVYLDSLNNVFEIREDAIPFTTGIPTHFYLGAFYRIRDVNHIGMLFSTRSYNGYSENMISLSYDRQFSRSCAFKASYSVINNTFDNLGIGLSLRLGSVQGYLMTENLITLFLPLNARHHSIHAGILINVFKNEDRSEIERNYSNWYPYPDYDVPASDAPGLEEQIRRYWEKKLKEENEGGK